MFIVMKNQLKMSLSEVIARGYFSVVAFSKIKKSLRNDATTRLVGTRVFKKVFNIRCYVLFPWIIICKFIFI